MQTPLEVAPAHRVSGKKLGVVAVLRAGVGMLDAVLDLIPVARVGFVGLYRDEQTLMPVEYYCKLPGDLAERDVIVLDPMLATGGSASAAIRLCKEQGARRVTMVALVAVPVGVARLEADHPDVEVVVGGARPRAQRPGLHPARPGRRRRPPVRDAVACPTAPVRFCPHERRADRLSGGRGRLCGRVPAGGAADAGRIAGGLDDGHRRPLGGRAAHAPAPDAAAGRPGDPGCDRDPVGRARPQPRVLGDHRRRCADVRAGRAGRHPAAAPGRQDARHRS